jgi:hypothetical protein
MNPSGSEACPIVPICRFPNQNTSIVFSDIMALLKTRADNFTIDNSARNRFDESESEVLVQSFDREMEQIGNR